MPFPRPTFPKQVRLGRHRIGIGPAVYLFVTLSTLIVELALAERQIPIFGRDFRRFHTIDTALETVSFLAGLIAAQFFLMLFLFWIMRLLHGRRSRAPLFYFNYLFLVTVAVAAVLSARFRILSYFSEAVSFQTLRNLGGGSLVEALLYVADEAVFLLVGLAVAALLYVLLYRLLGLGQAGDTTPLSGRPGPRLRLVAAAALLVALLLYAVQQVGDTRMALDRFLAPYLLYAGLSEISDFDRDGYSYYSSQRDASPFNPDRHPFALDIPGNGVDEDGFAGDFAFSGDAESVATPAFPGKKRHVILMVLESTRAETLTKTVAGRRVAPNLAAMARSGSWAPEAYSHVGFTRNSLKSLFTGRLEPADDRQSLFRDFKRNGYRVGVLSSQAEDFGGIAATVGERSHSDVFIDAKSLQRERLWSYMRDISLLVDGKSLLREMDRHFGAAESWKQPTFLYFNIQTAHFPYNFPGAPHLLPGPLIPRSEISFANREWVARTYWNGVAYGDWLVGQVASRLKSLGVYDDSVIVVLGDHGEELFEHGYIGHGQVLNRLQTQIPLVFSTPGVKIPRPVGLTDLRAMILEAAGGSVPRGREREAVFQYIGDLDRPSTIGMAERGGVITTLDLQTEEVSSTGLAERGHYRLLRRGSALKARADALVALWERQRWIRHVSNEGAAPAG